MDNPRKGNNNGSYACEKMANFIIRRNMQIKITARHLRNQSRAGTGSKRLTGDVQATGETGPAGGHSNQRGPTEGHVAAPGTVTVPAHVPLDPTAPETGAILSHLKEVASQLVYRDAVNNSTRLAATKVSDNRETAP